MTASALLFFDSISALVAFINALLTESLRMLLRPQLALPRGVVEFNPNMLQPDGRCKGVVAGIEQSARGRADRFALASSCVQRWRIAAALER